MTAALPPTIPTPDELYLDLRGRLPAWVMGSLAKAKLPTTSPMCGEGIMAGEAMCLEAVNEVEDIPKDPVYGALCRAFGEHYEWFANLHRQTRLDYAEGDFLDLHGKDRGIARAKGEDDARLRARLRAVPEVATERALKEAADAVLSNGEAEVFTLRYRQLAWGRHAWGRGRRWAVTVLPRPLGAAYRRRTMIWGRGHWGDDAWGREGRLRGPGYRLNPWLVAIVIIPPQVIHRNTAWGRFAWGRGVAWGGSAPDTRRYAALRRIIEERRAGGVLVQIWIQEEEE